MNDTAIQASIAIQMAEAVGELGSLGHIIIPFMKVIPKCPKCEHTKFDTTECDARGTHVIKLVHCAECGTVVGVTEFADIGTLVYRLAEKLQVPLQ